MALLFIFRPKYSPRAWISYSSPSLSELQNPDSHPRDEVPTGSRASTCLKDSLMLLVFSPCSPGLRLSVRAWIKCSPQVAPLELILIFKKDRQGDLRA